MIVNISEAKTNLSKLIDKVYHGQKVIIAKNNLPIVEMVVYKPEGTRKFGLLEGKLKVPDDFNDSDLEIEQMFYGKE